MFVISEVDASAIRASFDYGGEFMAMLELRRLFPGIAVDQARDCVRTIARVENVGDASQQAPTVPAQDQVIDAVMACPASHTS
jgi:hypothetical protein